MSTDESTAADYFEKVQQALEDNNLKHAYMLLKIASNRDPDNEDYAAALEELSAELGHPDDEAARSKDELSSAASEAADEEVHFSQELNRAGNENPGRRLWRQLLILFLLVGAIAAGLFLQGPQEIDVSPYSSIFPILSGQHPEGSHEILLVISGAEWNRLPAVERQDTLRRLYKAVKEAKYTRLVLHDEAGEQVGSAGPGILWVND